MTASRAIAERARGRRVARGHPESLEELDAGIANIGRSAKRSAQVMSLGVTPLVAANVLPPAMRCEPFFRFAHGEGIAIVPSFGLAACRQRRISLSQLISPVVRIEFHLISNRAKKLPPRRRGVRLLPQELYSDVGEPGGRSPR
jgi:hypothetical protein